MIECTNIDIRDVLPEFLQGTLDGLTHAHVQAHLESCAACTVEVQLLMAVRASIAPPRVDTARIAAAILPYRRQRSVYAAMRRPVALAAAFLLCAVGVSTVAVTHYYHAGQHPSFGTTPAAAAPGIAIVGVSDLSDDRLEQLISQMDQLEAAPPADPEPAVPSDVEGGA